LSDLKEHQQRQHLTRQLVLESLQRHFLPLAFLVVPVVGMSFFSGYRSTLQPVFNVLFLLAVAAAAWWGGIIAGILASVTALLLFSVIASHTSFVSPEHFRVTGILILLSVATLVSQIASARRRAEEILLASNALLEERVRERTIDLDKALRRLEQSNEQLQHFAYAVSHDLQEPLRGITISTQLLQRTLRTEPSPEAEGLVQDILVGASRLNQLVQDLLTFTRTLGQEQEQAASASLLDAVKAATFNLREQIQEANAQIYCPTSPSLAISAVLLEQILQNLISNAQYRTDKEPIINIDCRKSGEWWQVSVSDNGIGIHPDHYERVFQPFSRIRMRPEVAGTGLGLALCKRIVERSGGSIWVESKLGKGSGFHFTLRAAASNK
jgi:signal transduction histidine kinase